MDDMRLEIGADPDGVQVIGGPERIVRALADLDAPWDPLDWIPCVFCGAHPTDVDLDVPTGHYPTCPWRMAREWVAANPGSEQGG